MSARWTAARIRRAILLPKPRGAIAAYRTGMTARSDELVLVRHIAETADLIDVGPTAAGTAWLLVPMPAAMLDALAVIGAATEDFEDGHDREDAADGEPSIGALERVDQRTWAEGGLDDREDDPDGLGEEETDLGADEDEPDFPGMPQPSTGPVLDGVPVYQANGDRPVTHHADLSEWRKL
jgi:hypothetical protein